MANQKKEWTQEAEAPYRYREKGPHLWSSRQAENAVTSHCSSRVELEDRNAEGARWYSRRMFLVSYCGVTPRL